MRVGAMPAGRKKLRLQLSIIFSFGLTIFKIPTQQQVVIVK